MADITVIGSFVMDMIASVDHFNRDGETLLAKGFTSACGGKGVNQAVAAARVGASVEMCGMVGDDSHGKIFLDLLKAEGVESRNVFVHPTAPTGMAQIQVDASGQNRIVVIPAANWQFGDKEIDLIDQSLRNTKIVIVQLELKVDVSCEILRRAKKYGATTILNPAPAAHLDWDVLQCADFVTPNEPELAALSGMPTDTEEQAIAAAEYLCSKGVKNVVATLGSKGALIVNATTKKIVPGFPVKAIDTIGAGDSFNGAFAAQLLKNPDLAQAVRFANAEGALAVTKRGAIPALPTLKEVEKFLNEHK